MTKLRLPSVNYVKMSTVTKGWLTSRGSMRFWKDLRISRIQRYIHELHIKKHSASYMYTFLFLLWVESESFNFQNFKRILAIVPEGIKYSDVYSTRAERELIIVSYKYSFIILLKIPKRLFLNLKQKYWINISRVKKRQASESILKKTRTKIIRISTRSTNTKITSWFRIAFFVTSYPDQFISLGYRDFCFRFLKYRIVYHVSALITKCYSREILYESRARYKVNPLAADNTCNSVWLKIWTC